MEKRPNRKPRVSRDLVAALVIAVFGGAGVGISLYGEKWFGSPEQRCKDSCALQGKEGVMANVYPKTMTGSRDGPMECRCR